MHVIYPADPNRLNVFTSSYPFIFSITTIYSFMFSHPLFEDYEMILPPIVHEQINQKDQLIPQEDRFDHINFSTIDYSELSTISLDPSKRNESTSNDATIFELGNSEINILANLIHDDKEIVKICKNCGMLLILIIPCTGAIKTPSWRRCSIQKVLLCNACGL